jgi:hypothetical protein
MKILYALIFVCLSLQAWVGHSATSAVSTSANEYSTTNQLEFEGTSNDDAYASRFIATDDFIWQVSFKETM